MRSGATTCPPVLDYSSLHPCSHEVSFLSQIPISTAVLHFIGLTPTLVSQVNMLQNRHLDAIPSYVPLHLSTHLTKVGRSTTP